MKIHKFISLTLVAVLSATLFNNSFAMDPDSSESLSDIVIPHYSDDGDLNDDIKDIKQNTQQVKQLQEKLRTSNAQLAELKVIYTKNKEEHDKLSKMLNETKSKCDNFELQLDVAKEELQKWSDDVLCTNCLCFRNPIDETKSLLRGNINQIPSSSIFRSKRFYKGVISGAVTVAIFLVGIYVFVYLIVSPAK